MAGRAVARWTRPVLGLALAACLLAPAARVLAADENTVAEAEPAPDPYGRENPRAMQAGLIAALQQRNLDVIAEYLDLENPQSEAALRKVAAFEQLLDDHGTFLKRLSVSQDPGGKVDDGLAPDQEAIGEIALDEAPVPIIAVRSERAEGGPVWLVSRETLDALPAAPPAPPLEDQAVDQTKAPLLTLFGAPLRSWLILFAVGVAIYVVVILAVRLLRAATRLFAPERAEKPARRLLKAFAHPAALYFVYLAVSALAGPLGAGVVERTALERISALVGWLALVWFIWGLVGVADDFAVRRARAISHYERIGLINFICRMIRLALLALTLAACLATFGVNVTASLAALGVGGLALALGARKTVENLVGSIMVLMDKPVRIGDSCDIGGMIGDVEDIGLLSTRIRTRDRTVLTIPNSQFSGSNIENRTARDRYYVNQFLAVPLSVGAQGIATALETVRTAFEAEPTRYRSQCPIRFKGIAEGNFQIEIHGYLHGGNSAEFHLNQERLMLDIFRRLEAQGIALAPPTSMVVARKPEDRAQEEA